MKHFDSVCRFKVNAAGLETGGILRAIESQALRLNSDSAHHFVISLRRLIGQTLRMGEEMKSGGLVDVNFDTYCRTLIVSVG